MNVPAPVRPESVRMVTVWLPDWPVVAAGAGDRPAMVLRANRVVACSAPAVAAGVRHGDRKRQAQQRCPAIEVLDHDPDRDARAFEPVVRAAAELTPRVEVVEPGTLCFDARGPSRYYGGDEAFARRLAGDVVAAVADPVPIGVGIADGRFASAVAARRAVGGPPVIVAAGDSASWLAPQPISWLSDVESGIDSDLVELFGRLGLTRLGSFAALSAADVLGRFGPSGRLAHRLAAGLDERPADHRDPPEHHRRDHVFDHPVTSIDHLVFAAKRLADELVGALADEGRVITRLVVSADSDHGERTERAWYRPLGLTAAAVVERVRWQLDGWIHSGTLTAGVVHLALLAEATHADDGEQIGLWGGRSALDDRAVRAVTRLSGLVGDEQVVVPAWQGGRQPGSRFRWVSATSTDLGDADDTARRLRPDPDTDGPWPGALPAPSPAVVPAAPTAVEVVDGSGRTVSVSGRGELSAPPAEITIDGRRHPIAAWAGPWPIEERWWDLQRRRRLARLQIVTDQATAHLVQVEHGRWWLAATYG